MAKLGIDHLKKLAHVGFQLAVIIDDLATNKDIDIWEDLKRSMALLPDARDSVTHFNDAAAELKDLDGQERADLYAYCVAECKLPQTDIEKDIERALLTACKFHEIYLIWSAAPSPAPAPQA